MSDMQFDVLKEIGNIGSGNAATALSKLIQDKINMQEPKVELARIEYLPDFVGGAEKIMIGILITLDGDINGMMMFMMDRESANRLMGILLDGINKEAGPSQELEESALKEVGNIIAGAYLASLSTLLGVTIEQSIPYMSMDMAGAILSVPAIEFGKIGDRALIIETKFWRDTADVNGYFILIPTIESYDIIMTSLGL
jgi:chemotaxis protein CheC